MCCAWLKGIMFSRAALVNCAVWCAALSKYLHLPHVSSFLVRATVFTPAGTSIMAALSEGNDNRYNLRNVLRFLSPQQCLQDRYSALDYTRGLEDSNAKGFDASDGFVSYYIDLYSG